MALVAEQIEEIGANSGVGRTGEPITGAWLLVAPRTVGFEI